MLIATLLKYTPPEHADYANLTSALESVISVITLIEAEAKSLLFPHSFKFSFSLLSPFFILLHRKIFLCIPLESKRTERESFSFDISWIFLVLVSLPFIVFSFLTLSLSGLFNGGATKELLFESSMQLFLLDVESPSDTAIDGLFVKSTK
jgi:hypothetical protein